ncbi:enoyl-CoA hydratase/isomerase family protein [Cupriavidus sp. UYPR2.512]|uniref:enoyl-CoA hydratase/isomerase family protein n=1 Tax=Cupriavidus sp. UYPR2.512 TaxID=1080187 RepID=UPI00036794D8|nr:enoyl-CoA hydratase/isomerase family protein [Cupriavidus sp. UYPR2.512]UIF89885.1 enoyl-CoA hydratase/isomerase family protein [Cupriavidus necator]
MSENPQGQVPELVVDGHVAVITLRRPEVANRLEPEDLDLLRTYLETVNADSRVRVLRLEGQGRHFCSGFNIGRLGGDDVGARFEALANALEQARPVTIAVLHGGVYGGATDLALACDFRFGAAGAEMSVPAARLGLLFYRGGMERYVTRLGLATAKRILLMADKFDAAAMLACGYLDRLEDGPEALRALAAQWSEALAGMAPLALLGMKKHMNRIARGELDAAGLARDITEADASEDLCEGALAWREKRAPRFTGR